MWISNVVQENLIELFRGERPSFCGELQEVRSNEIVIVAIEIKLQKELRVERKLGFKHIFYAFQTKLSPFLKHMDVVNMV